MIQQVYNLIKVIDEAVSQSADRNSFDGLVGMDLHPVTLQNTGNAGGFSLYSKNQRDRFISIIEEMYWELYVISKFYIPIFNYFMTKRTSKKCKDCI